MTQVRNVTVDLAAPVEQWPDEAIETVLDRGGLSDWRRLARCISDDPWGPVARSVEAISEWDEHYGVDRLMRRVKDRARSDVDARGRARYAERIRRARASTGLSQRDLALLAGTSASRLSDYENAKVAPTTDVLGRIELVTERILAANQRRSGA